MSTRNFYVAVKRAGGFSLIELMVALALGLLLTLVVGYVYLGSRQASRLQEANAYVQQNTRLGFSRLSKDVRMAGFAGCSFQTSTNVVNGAPAYTSLIDQPVFGFDDSAIGTLPAGMARLRGDVLRIVSADDSDNRIDSYDPPAAQFKLAASHDFADGDILLATNCQHAAIFQVSNANTANVTIVHNTGNAVSPGNSIKDLGFTSVSAKDARIFRVRSWYYYVGNNNGVPSLMRLQEGPSSNTTRDIVEGVEDMQLVYGVDTDGDRDVDGYFRADQIATLAMAGPLSGGNWSRVLSVRVALLLASTPGESVTERGQQYSYNGSSVVPNDRRLRRVANYTIAIRNRL